MNQLQVFTSDGRVPVRTPVPETHSSTNEQAGEG